MFSVELHINNSHNKNRLWKFQLPKRMLSIVSIVSNATAPTRSVYKLANLSHQTKTVEYTILFPVCMVRRWANPMARDLFSYHSSSYVHMRQSRKNSKSEVRKTNFSFTGTGVVSVLVMFVRGSRRRIDNVLRISSWKSNCLNLHVVSDTLANVC